jgi:hypothetical protein
MEVLDPSEIKVVTVAVQFTYCLWGCDTTDIAT